MVLHFINLICIFLTVAECGVPKIAPNAKAADKPEDPAALATFINEPARIVKGEDVIPNSWPWMAALINGKYRTPSINAQCQS